MLLQRAPGRGWVATEAGSPATTTSPSPCKPASPCPAPQASRGTSGRVVRTRSLGYFTQLGSGASAGRAHHTQLVQREATPASAAAVERVPTTGRIKFEGVHHVGLLCKNLETSMEFYQGVLGLEVNPDRPHDRLPYRGAWLWIGSEMIHLMELPDPDPKEGRPEHGGRDRHFCVGIASVAPLVEKLEASSTEFTTSKSGRPAVFFRDPDMNCLEVAEMGPWR